MKMTLYKYLTFVIYGKTIKVIDSCKSLSQLQVAKEYCKLFFKQLSSTKKLFLQNSFYIMYYDLQRLLIKKEKELL